jgi:hypothetical protein
MRSDRSNGSPRKSVQNGTVLRLILAQPNSSLVSILASTAEDFPMNETTSQASALPIPTMQTPTIDIKKIRDQLKTKRNLLFDEFSKNPKNARLAIEIRLIDDQVAELTEHLIQQR